MRNSHMYVLSEVSSPIYNRSFGRAWVCMNVFVCRAESVMGALVLRRFVCNDHIQTKNMLTHRPNSYEEFIQGRSLPSNEH